MFYANILKRTFDTTSIACEKWRIWDWNVFSAARDEKLENPLHMQKVCLCQLFFYIAIRRMYRNGAICYIIWYVIYERFRAECNKQKKKYFRTRSKLTDGRRTPKNGTTKGKHSAYAILCESWTKFFGVCSEQEQHRFNHIPCGGEHLTFSNKLNVHLKFTFNWKMLAHVSQNYQNFCWTNSSKKKKTWKYLVESWKWNFHIHYSTNEKARGKKIQTNYQLTEAHRSTQRRSRFIPIKPKYLVLFRLIDRLQLITCTLSETIVSMVFRYSTPNRPEEMQTYSKSINNWEIFNLNPYECALCAPGIGCLSRTIFIRIKYNPLLRLGWIWVFACLFHGPKQ